MCFGKFDELLIHFYCQLLFSPYLSSPNLYTFDGICRACKYTFTGQMI